ncbi:High-affinity branched-chain amino acid transport ATP-binding protein LivF [Methylobacterium crusticola]|uniref:High-affinity branched-chain amino acid transport ATP-binding protein LivF n=1 Tax=Methylobacterium crusticola TaxID=1697972 RepID=A0ABQ4R8L3_9HYPH|nr:ABC transporter ATP-binding protein [Methylobacterium crusticola]GJD53134.1 High-affinity branched-chain amino acid transport ATP-binding protein LivF [Methylobacterium crusticola]
MLEIRSLSAGYGALNALEGVSARLPAGARLGIFGHNGAGKTTLLRCLVGAHAARAGEVVLDGEPVRPGNVAATVRRGIAFVPQGHNVFPTLTVAQNLATAGLLFDGGFAGEVLRIFPLLEERRGQRAGSLSGGEQQMLALGMALMTRPKWLLLDEPSTGLAPVIVRDVMSQLATVSAAFGTGLVIVEQNVPATLKVVEHCLILKSGRTVFEGTAATLAAKPDLWEWF